MRKKKAPLALIVVMTLVPVGLGTSPAWAEATGCVGVVNGGSYGTIVVPEGAYCELNATVVRGDVIVREDAELHIGHAGGSTIDGNVEGHKAEIVHVHFSTVGGSIRIKDGERPDLSHPDAVVNFNTVDGNIEVAKMVGGVVVGFNAVAGHISLHDNVITPQRLLRARFQTVEGNIHVFNNEGPGDKAVQSNTVDGIVHCHGNEPAFTGGPNTAQRTLDQCF